MIRAVQPEICWVQENERIGESVLRLFGHIKINRNDRIVERVYLGGVWEGVWQVDTEEVDWFDKQLLKKK